MKGNNCALFVIGDGGYERGQITTSPICYTTAIGVANAPLPGIDTDWGEQVILSPGGRLGAVTFRLFEPEERTTYWTEGPVGVRRV